MSTADVFKAKKGLEGVVVDSSGISKTIPEKARLTYRGYAVDQLANNCSFEEVVCLLWDGELPTRARLEEFVAKERSLRSLSPALLEACRLFPKSAHPMDALRTGMSFLALECLDAKADLYGSLREDATVAIAKAPTIVAAIYRLMHGKEPVSPRSDISLAENFFYMCFEEIPGEQIVKALDASLTLYAEHGFNASTFTARVVTSTMSDMFSAIVAAIGALKGPLHGGANEQVMHTLKEIGCPDKAEAWLRAAMAEKRKVMGFGHRLYKHGDSRVPLMKEYAEKLAELRGDSTWKDISDVLERVMVEEKGIHPNLDFPAGPAYYLMGFDIELFTPIFVMARISGWAAHIMEQAEDNRLIRPLSEYSGVGERDFTPLESRS